MGGSESCMRGGAPAPRAPPTVSSHRTATQYHNRPHPQAQCNNCGGDFCRVDGGIDPSPTPEPTLNYAPTVTPSVDPFKVIDCLRFTPLSLRPNLRTRTSQSTPRFWMN